MRYRSKMFQRLLAITIFTILIAGTISGILNLFYGSIINVGGSSGSYYSAFALKGDQQNNGDSKKKLPTPDSGDNSKQRQKTNDLIEEANKAAIEARLAAYAANNATQNSRFFASAAQETESVVKKILDLPADDSNGTKKKKAAGENDNLGIAMMDAKKKHQEAKLAAKNAKKLSDRAIAMEKEANKAGKLARQAEKDLNKSANTDTNTDDGGQEQGAVVKGDTKPDNNLKKVSGDRPVSGTAENSSDQNQDSKS